jgi:hypothetical protein
MSKFPALRLWHSSTGSFEYYIANLEAQAEQEGAPKDSLYRGGDGWVTLRDLSDTHRFRTLLKREGIDL